MKTLRLILIAPFFACAVLAADNSAPAAAPTPPAPAKAAPPAVSADPAAIDAVLKALRFDEMLGKAIDQQKQMIQQMIQRVSLPGTPKEEVAAFQKKAIDTAFTGLSPEDIHAVAARNYGEAFTTAELLAIADFYNSPAGQAFLAKRPQAEQKIATILRPKFMEATQKIQQMTRDFSAEQQAKAAAAKDKEGKASPAPTASAASAKPEPTPKLILPPKS